jgi:transposase InsO family protein
VIRSFESKQDITIEEMCDWSALTRSVYYYQVRGGKPGRAVSTTTSMKDGTVVPNEAVVEVIKNMFRDDEFANFGYEYTTVELQHLNYIINHKKVYRLMDENNLLLNKTITTSGPRNFIKFRTVEASYPMEYLSMDIKYIWVEGDKRNYYLLTIMDIYSRKVLEQIFKSSIRKKDVLQMLKRLHDRNSIKGVTIRNDNGPQFIANQVKNFLRLAEVRQEFSHVATPQDNAYIEAYHSILDSLVVQRFEFASYYDAKCVLERFKIRYNERRRHRSIDMMTPCQKWDAGLALRSSLEHLNVRENESRLIDASKKLMENRSLVTSLDSFYGFNEICSSEELNGAGQMNQNVLNHFEENVRIIGG